MEKVLLIGVPEVEAVQAVAAKLRMRTAVVDAAQYGDCIGNLAGYVTTAVDSSIPELETIPSEGVIVMCELKNNRLDRFLHTLRAAGLVFPYKAVLTKTNSTWNVLQLAHELEKDRRAMEAQEKA